MLNTTTIENFKLKWRWTDSKYCLMPSKDLDSILPLDSESAEKVWEQSLTYASKDNDFSPNPELFDNIRSIKTEKENDVTTWLKNLLGESRIIVSWDNGAGVLTTTDIFIRYWSDFCYPSSDDVSIWPEDESWVLHYWHEEVFWYGTAKSV